MVDDAESVELVRAHVSAYVEGVIAGTTTANIWVQAACRRFRDDLARQDIEMRWAAVARFEAFCSELELTLSHAGKPFTLLPWQLWVAAAIFGWHWVADGSRRTEFVVLQIARKAGKSTFAAAIALFVFRDGRRGNRVHVISNTTEQSEIILSTASEMYRVRWPDDYATDFREFPRKHFRMRDFDGLFTIIVAKARTLDGLNPSCWIGDEASEWRGRFLTKLITAQGARENPLGIIVSTPGDNPDLIYTAEILPDAIKVLEGELVLDRNFYALFGIDEEDDPGDERCWEKANPGLPDGQPKIAFLRKQWLDMSRSAVRRSEFCRFHGARFSAVANRWLDMSYWDEGSPPITIGELRGRPAWLGVDLSAKHDLTCVVACVPLDDGKLALIGRYWWPERRARDREQEYGVPLKRWAADGLVTMCPGDVVDLREVRDEIRHMAQILSVQFVGYDRWNARPLALELEAEGVPMQEYDMSNNTFVPGCAVFERLWMQRKFAHGNDPVMRRACADAGAREVSTGQHRLVKAHRFALIDPLVAAIYAVHGWSTMVGAKTLSYEHAEKIVM